MNEWNLSSPSFSSSTTQNIKAFHNTNVKQLSTVLYLSIHPSTLQICLEYLPCARLDYGRTHRNDLYNPYLQELTVIPKMLSSVSPMPPLKTVEFLLLLHQGKKAGELTLPRQCLWVHELCLPHFFACRPPCPLKSDTRSREKLMFTAVA